LGGTSEGGMTIARFDDQRYGEMVCGRFINSFSIEYNYFTPTPEAGELGGQTDVPTLNIIGTKDQYFGPEDSVAKIVVADDVTGYGDKNLTGNGYKTLVRQGLDTGLVVVLEDGVHSPCNTHDNFLRQLFDMFFSRPGSIWELDEIWNTDPTMKDILQVQQSSVHDKVDANVVQAFVPKSKFPNKWSLRKVEVMRQLHSAKADQELAAQLELEAKELKAEHQEAHSMLDRIRAHASMLNPMKGSKPKSTYYDNDRVTRIGNKHHKEHR